LPARQSASQKETPMTFAPPGTGMLLLARRV